MQGTKNNEQLSGENAAFQLSAMTVLGDRSDQQDSFGFSLKEKEGLAIVCDGMGGLRAGKQASSCTVQRSLQQYLLQKPDAADTAFLLDCARQSNALVRSMKDSRGRHIHAGTTSVSVLIRNQNLYWVSVGDSRGYLFRQGQYIQFTQDHTYRTVLDGQRHAGRIDHQQYLQESKRAEALISYIGMEPLDLIDYSQNFLPLQHGDKILLMSDGLYKLVGDAEISRVIHNFTNIQEALRALEMKANQRAAHDHIRRDNMTLILIQMK